MRVVDPTVELVSRPGDRARIEQLAAHRQWHRVGSGGHVSGTPGRGSRHGGGLVRLVPGRDLEGDDVTISGDFTLLPVFALGALEQSLRGVAATPENLKSKIEEAYYRLNIQSPGVTPADFTTAIMNAVTPPQAA